MVGPDQPTQLLVAAPPRPRCAGHPYAAEVRPLGSQEPIEGPVSTRYRVFLPASATDITPADAVRWRGMTLELQGEV